MVKGKCKSAGKKQRGLSTSIPYFSCEPYARAAREHKGALLCMIESSVDLNRVGIVSLGIRHASEAVTPLPDSLVPSLVVEQIDTPTMLVQQVTLVDTESTPVATISRTSTSEHTRAARDLGTILAQGERTAQTTPRCVNIPSRAIAIRSIDAETHPADLVIDAFPYPTFPNIPPEAPLSFNDFQLQGDVARCLRAFKEMGAKAFGILQHVASTNPKYTAKADPFGIAPSSHLSVDRAFGVPGTTHHGVYIGEGYIVDVGTIPPACESERVKGAFYKHFGESYGLAWTRKSRGVGLTTLEQFTERTKGKFHLVVYHPDVKLRRVANILFDTVNAIGPRPYNLIKRNCEAFSMYVRTGIHESAQVNRIMNWYTKTALNTLIAPLKVLGSVVHSTIGPNYFPHFHFV